MKTELLATLATLTGQINALPDDPPPLPPPDAPTGFAITGVSGTNPLVIDLTWNNADGMTAICDYRGGPTSTYGPDDWTTLPLNEGPPFDGHGSALSLVNPDGQTIEFRLRAMRSSDGQLSDPVALNFPAP